MRLLQISIIYLKKKISELSALANCNAYYSTQISIKLYYLIT